MKKRLATDSIRIVSRSFSLIFFCAKLAILHSRSPLYIITQNILEFYIFTQTKDLEVDDRPLDRRDEIVIPGGVAILLEKSFSGRAVGDGVSFDAQRGAVYGRLGHNGAGKSTIMDWIPGLKTPDAENRCKECAQTNGLSARSAP